MPSSPTSPQSPSLTSPADGVPAILPVTTRVQVLPFGELTWQNFERLCHRLACLDGDAEHVARYGRQGDAQEGLDIYARQVNGRYHCLQAKRHKSFAASQIAEAVDLFLAGTWASRAERFTIAVQASLRSTTVQDEIERQANKLSEKNIVFFALDGEDLTDRLRDHPRLIDDFFGRPWVSALLGEDAASSLKTRLDGAAFARARTQLTNVYESHFHFVDPGNFGSIGDAEAHPALTLLERYLKPDVLVQEKSPSVGTADGRTVDGQDGASTRTIEGAPRDRGARSDSTESSRTRRLPLAEWVGDSQRLVILGDAGSGKSTLLRVLALDVLHQQSHFPELASRWGQHLPVYIPFARWSAQAARDGGVVGIKEIVRRSIEQLLTESLADLIDKAIDDRRVLLLIDGLDEWSNEQAARTTLSALVTSVEAHDIPAIVSGRPRGLDRIGALPATWRRAIIAPLSVPQQADIASRWFSRFSSASAEESSQRSDASLRANRFMAELARDASLGALASTPLLLVGLVTLALRGQILPRTRAEVYNQLVRVLLEVHPNSRATASGDTEPRFRHASEEQRRAAIARLAFAVREHGDGAGMAMNAARDMLRSYLVSPTGPELDNMSATKAAAEILSVNSETQGLIVEKAPGEVGFVHASFEEYLGAEHIGGWPFLEIEAFVRSHCGQSRWRNVIANLLGYVQRRDEFDRLVAHIEEPAPDELSQLNKQALLGDIAFGVAVRAATTAKRLALCVMTRVELQDWMPARREALASVLKALSDPTLKADVDGRVRQWIPARLSWRQSLIEVLGSWVPTEKLQHTLFRALHDEEQGVQRAAAAAYARAFSKSLLARDQLVERLARSRDLYASVAMLECLALGWPDAEQSVALFQEAWSSRQRELRLVGAFGLSARGMGTPEMRDAAVYAQWFWSGISSEYQSLAAWMLVRYWPNDPTLIQGAISRVTGSSNSEWEYGSAGSYLLNCDVQNPNVRQWVLDELSRDHPFNFHMGSDLTWQQVGRFALVDPQIRVATNAYWKDPKHRVIGMRNLVSYVASVPDPEIAAVLREVLTQDKLGFNRYWALRAMLNGWGRDHPEVSATIDALITAPNEELDDLVSMMPEIYRDKDAARERLLRMSCRPNMRNDLLTSGFAECGCDGTDEEVVQAILKFPEQNRIGDGTFEIFRSFNTHPSVRALARRRLQEANPPLAAIAGSYANDPEFGQDLLDAANPLPVDLRTQIVEFAATGASGTALEKMLGLARSECDPELRVRMSILKYGAVPSEQREFAIRELLEQSIAVGPDFEEVRAAALAGLIAMGAVDQLVNLQDQGKPIRLHTGTILYPMPSLDRLICEHYSDIESAFGPDMWDRFEGAGYRRELDAILCVAPNASPASKNAFLKLADQGRLPISSQALQALAAERPRSNMLLEHCWKMLTERDYDNNTAIVNADVAEILRSHFPDDAEIRQKLVDLHKQGNSATSTIALAIYSPQAAELDSADHHRRRTHFADCAVAVHISAALHNGDSFVALLERMVTREHQTQFDPQDSINRAVHQRLRRDPELAELLRMRLRQGIDGSISGSFARYLAAAGRLDETGRTMVQVLLEALTTDQQLVVVAYDAVAARWRALRATLLDAMTAGLDMN